MTAAASSWQRDRCHNGSKKTEDSENEARCVPVQVLLRQALTRACCAAYSVCFGCRDGPRCFISGHSILHEPFVSGSHLCRCPDVAQRRKGHTCFKCPAQCPVSQWMLQTALFVSQWLNGQTAGTQDFSESQSRPDGGVPGWTGSSVVRLRCSGPRPSLLGASVHFRSTTRTEQCQSTPASSVRHAGICTGDNPPERRHRLCGVTETSLEQAWPVDAGADGEGQVPPWKSQWFAPQTHTRQCALGFSKTGARRLGEYHSREASGLLLALLAFGPRKKTGETDRPAFTDNRDDVNGWFCQCSSVWVNTSTNRVRKRQSSGRLKNCAGAGEGGGRKRN